MDSSAFNIITNLHAWSKTCVKGESHKQAGKESTDPELSTTNLSEI